MNVEECTVDPGVVDGGLVVVVGCIVDWGLVGGLVVVGVDEEKFVVVDVVGYVVGFWVVDRGIVVVEVGVGLFEVVVVVDMPVGMVFVVDVDEYSGDLEVVGEVFVVVIDLSGVVVVVVMVEGMKDGALGLSWKDDIL